MFSFSVPVRWGGVPCRGNSKMPRSAALRWRFFKKKVGGIGVRALGREGKR